MAGSARALAGEFGSVDEARRRTARDPDEYLAALDDRARDDRLQVTLARAADGIVAAGHEYPALPGTAHMLLRSRPGGNELYRSRWRAEASASRDIDRALVDVSRVQIEILPAPDPEPKR